MNGSGKTCFQYGESTHRSVIADVSWLIANGILREAMTVPDDDLTTEQKLAIENRLAEYYAQFDDLQMALLGDFSRHRTINTLVTVAAAIAAFVTLYLFSVNLVFCLLAAIASWTLVRISFPIVFRLPDVTRQDVLEFHAMRTAIRLTNEASDRNALAQYLELKNYQSADNNSAKSIFHDAVAKFVSRFAADEEAFHEAQRTMFESGYVS